MIPPETHLVLQPNGYTCGPCALRHALLCYGQRVSVRRIAALAGTNYDGTSNTELDTAANALGFKLEWVRYDTAPMYREALRNLSHARIPAIVAVDRLEHWVTAVHATSRHVWICDSSHPGPVLQRLTWRAFLQRASIWMAPKEVYFDLYPVRLA